MQVVRVSFKRSIGGVLISSTLSTAPSPAQTVARQWNEENLAAIRIDFPAPTVHARNLFHLSVAMGDARAAYDPAMIDYLHNENATIPDSHTLVQARDEAISFAAFRVLKQRYAFSINSAVAVWGVKKHCDYVRPISAIRYLGRTGDLPMTPDLVEEITPATIASYHSHLSDHSGFLTYH